VAEVAYLNSERGRNRNKAWLIVFGAHEVCVRATVETRFKGFHSSRPSPLSEFRSECLRNDSDGTRTGRR
jgi:hypothetical protein